MATHGIPAGYPRARVVHQLPKRGMSEPVRFGHVGMSFALPFSAALRHGFFPDTGLDVQVSTFADGWEVAWALAAGTIDVGIGGHLQAASTIEAGAELAFLGPLGFEQDPDNLIIVLLGSAGVRSIADLKGKTVGVTTRRGQGELMLAQALDEVGLRLSSVSFETMRMAAIAEAFSAGTLDAAILAEPAATKLLNAGAMLIQRGSLGTALGARERVAITGILARRAWINEDPDRAAKMTAAIGRGSALLREAPDTLAALIAAETGLPAELCAAVATPAFPAELRAADLQLVYDLALRFGLLNKPMDASTIIHAAAAHG